MYHLIKLLWTSSIIWSLLNYLKVEIAINPSLEKLFNEAAGWTILSLGWIFFIVALLFCYYFVDVVEHCKHDEDVKRKNDSILYKTYRYLIPLELLGLLILGHYWVVVSFTFFSLVSFLMRTTIKNERNDKLSRLDFS